jgi:hypothetical protein
MVIRVFGSQIQRYAKPTICKFQGRISSCTRRMQCNVEDIFVNLVTVHNEVRVTLTNSHKYTRSAIIIRPYLFPSLFIAIKLSTEMSRSNWNLHEIYAPSNCNNPFVSLLVRQSGQSRPQPLLNVTVMKYC